MYNNIITVTFCNYIISVKQNRACYCNYNITLKQKYITR